MTKGNSCVFILTSVFPGEKAEEIDVKKEWEELKDAEKELAEIENKIRAFLNEAG